MPTGDKLESVNCPLCKCTSKHLAFKGQGFKPYEISECHGCGLYYLSKRLREAEAIALYRADDYFSSEQDGYSNYAEQRQALQLTYRHLLFELNKRGATGGRLLEIGCGFGYFLEEAENYYSYRVGSDFSTLAVQEASKKSDKVFLGGTESVVIEVPFDMIVASHVIEHVYQPLQFVGQLAEKLKSSGHLLLAAPDMGSFWRKAMGRSWPSFKFPEHVLFFDKKTLALLFEKSGFTDICEVSFPHAFPLGLVAAKLGLKAPEMLSKYPIWLPSTTIAIIGRKQ